MSTADNKALVRRFWEGLVGTGDSALADELLAPGYIVHYAGNPPEEFDPASGTLLGNFPQALTHLSHITAAVALEQTG